MYNHADTLSWIHVLTDGSASNAVTDGGAGIYARFPDQPTEAVCLATGKYCSNYKAEVEALSKAAEGCLRLTK